VTGFADGEGSFIVGMFVNNKYKNGYQVQLIFKITLHNKDLLSQVQSYFGVGTITKHGNTTMQYCVKSIKDLSVIISHFDKYPLISQKRADYELFKQAAKFFKNKEHLTDDGFKEILSIRASMNLGLSDELKIAFPNIIPASRPLTVDSEVIDPN
jgi:hypothetical protein